MLTVEDIIEATGGELLSENGRTFKGVSIDSRKISEEEIFFAIRGERFDGHEFLGKALLKGSGTVVDIKQGQLPEGKTVIYVKDTLRALQDLAHFLRMKLDIPVVAVTGSNGKTTTKEMIYGILSEKFRTLKNEGNLNNHIGLPLSLTRLNPYDEAVVLEMGMNASGEIRRLCEIAGPTHGVITNVGSAHVGRLGSYEAVRAAKLEVLERVSVAVVNNDDRFLMQGVEELRNFNAEIITFGMNNPSDVMAKHLKVSQSGSAFMLETVKAEGVWVSLNVPGLFNVYNALAASAACVSLGVGLGEIKTALEKHKSIPMRFEIMNVKGITVINDSYNANPSSVEKSVNELVRLGAGGRTVAVLGDMRELDAFAEKEHRAAGDMVREAGVNVFVAVGELMAIAAEECRKEKGGKPAPDVYIFPDADAAKKNIMDILRQGDTVLVKGSRSMSMERIVEGITNAV
ncbi:MAG: UDP-N-acetylmuramoyl-tripeptide--D-alanyl-D-alanine ligase [Nitrospiraceae bacterium]|nr:MAG: UDP-N-acetylmuramoyl-tripeptide--D-alanyl-D-alanine ligase [Nitrospiraceae bacterium]